jgi:hypothetical protein
MSEEEVHNSADSFPIEFHDMKERRRVLYGLDVIAELKIDSKNYRRQVEHELRSKLLRLRQQGASKLSHPDGLLALCVDSCVYLLRWAAGWHRRQETEIGTACVVGG